MYSKDGKGFTTRYPKKDAGLMINWNVWKADDQGRLNKCVEEGTSHELH